MSYFQGYYRSFKLGQLYITDSGRIVRFIKVTPKGFNILDINSHKCILNHHLYSKDFSGKEVPLDVQLVKNVCVWNGIIFKEVNELKELK
jgi:hypothetical protein